MMEFTERGGAEARGPHAHPKRDLLRHLRLLTRHGSVRRGDVRDASVVRIRIPSRANFSSAYLLMRSSYVEDVVRGLHDGD